MTEPARKRPTKFDFDVALSFAGEDRKYVEKVAANLKKMDIKVFYDMYSKIDQWGKDLYSYLDEIYRRRARYTVMFISKSYSKKLWTNHERKSAQARAFLENKEYILPVRFDKTEIPGVLPTIGYIDPILDEISPSQLAEMIKQKIGTIKRSNFLPENIDRLFLLLKINKEKEKIFVGTVASHLFESFKLMTKKERYVLSIAVEKACPCGVPENIHLKLEYLQRLTKLSKDNIMSMFSRLDCLAIKSRIYKIKEEEKEKHYQDEFISSSPEMIEIKYLPLPAITYRGKLIPIKNATYILVGVYACLEKYLCSECAAGAIERVDFSVLSRHGYADKS